MTNNSLLPSSPRSEGDKSSSSEENSLQKQFSFFKIEESDSAIVKSNKEKITQNMKILNEKGFIIASSLKDYVKKDCFSGGQGTVYKAIEKKEHDSHLNPDGSYFGGRYLALKVEDFFLGNRLQIKLRELELMSDKFQKSAIQAEKMFFAHDPEKLTHSVNIVMPWYNHTLISWLLKRNNNKGQISDIKDCKRRFEEVRRMLGSILKGISAMHFEDYVHMDIKFENILVDEFMNETEDENGEIKPILISEAIIADFGMVKDLTKESSSSSFTGFTIEYAAPEVCPPSKPLVSPKADIYSFGVMLYKIFVDENDGSFRLRHTNPNLEIKSGNIKKRIDVLFPKEIVTDAIIDDITKIINTCLEDNLELRTQANLLSEHEFFKISQKGLSGVPDFEIENTFEYGLKFLEGKNGYPKDLKKAREIFAKLSTLFYHVPATLFYGFMVYFGLGGNIDEQLGKIILLQSAEIAKSYFESRCVDSLGFSEFASGFIVYWGHGVEPVKNSKALESFKQSSNKENSFAQCWIGDIYKFGCGVKKDLSSAFDYFKMSSLEGNCIAQNDLGVLFQKGLGIQQDYNEAFKWFKHSADQGYAEAQNNIGLLHCNGHGVGVDKEKAIHYFKLAAEQGHARARFNLGKQSLENGEGTPNVLNLAIELHEEAENEQGQSDGI